MHIRALFRALFHPELLFCGSFFLHCRSDDHCDVSLSHFAAHS